MHSFYTAIRPVLGLAALVFGTIALLLFLGGIPLTLVGAHFFAGLGFREGPQPTPEQLEAAVSRQMWWAIWHRLLPLFLLTAGLLGYGIYEWRAWGRRDS